MAKAGFNPSRFPFDPTKVTHVVPLLAVLAGVLWALALTWLILASSTAERIVAGVTFCVLLVAMLLAIIRLSRVTSAVITGVDSHHHESVSGLAKDLVEAPVVPSDHKDIDSGNVVPGKSGDYLVADPRPGWTLRWLSLAQFIMEETAIVDQDFIATLKKRFPAGDPTDENILNIRLNTEYDIRLTPGRSTINGYYPFCLYHAPLFTQIIILPWSKFSSNRGQNDTLLSFAIERLSGLLQTSAVNSFETIRRSDGRPAVIAECTEELEDVTVNGVEHQNIRCRTTVVCLESATTYYAIALTYPEGSAVAPADIERLRTIVDSFRLVAPLAPEESLAEAITGAQNRRRELAFSNATEITSLNILMLANRFAVLDLSRSEDIDAMVQETGRFLDLVGLLFGDLSEVAELEEAYDLAIAGQPDRLVAEAKVMIDGLVV